MERRAKRAQIMLGMVPSQMLPLFRQTSNQLSQQSLQTGQPEPLTQSGQIHSGQSQMQPAQQNQMQIGQHGQIPVNQSQPPNNISMQQLMQPPQHIAASPQIQVIQQPQSQITQSLLQSVQPESQGLNLPVQPAMQTSAHNVLMQPRVSSILSSQSQQPSVQPTLGILHQPPLPQQPRPSLQSFMPPAQVQNLPPQSLGFQPSITLHQLPQVPFQSGNISTTMGMVFQKHSQPPLPNQPPPPQPYQMGSGSATGAVSLVGSDVICQGTGQSNMASSAGILHIGPGVAVQGGRGSNLVPGSSSMGPDLSWAPGLPPSGGVQFSAVPLGIGEQVGICGELTTGMTASVGPPNIDDGNRAYSAVGSASGGMTAGSSDRIASSPSHSPSHMPVEGMPHPQQQVSQGIQLPPEMNSLLQQVMGLTQEQINSLPPEQRQQVLHLQQTLQLQQTLH